MRVVSFIFIGIMAWNGAMAAAVLPARSGDAEHTKKIIRSSEKQALQKPPHQLEKRGKKVGPRVEVRREVVKKEKRGEEPDRFEVIKKEKRREELARLEVIKKEKRREELARRAEALWIKALVKASNMPKDERSDEVEPLYVIKTMMGSVSLVEPGPSPGSGSSLERDKKELKKKTFTFFKALMDHPKISKEWKVDFLGKMFGTYKKEFWEIEAYARLAEKFVELGLSEKYNMLTPYMSREEMKNEYGEEADRVEIIKVAQSGNFKEFLKEIAPYSYRFEFNVTTAMEGEEFRPFFARDFVTVLAADGVPDTFKKQLVEWLQTRIQETGTGEWDRQNAVELDYYRGEDDYLDPDEKDLHQEIFIIAFQKAIERMHKHFKAAPVSGGGGGGGAA